MKRGRDRALFEQWDGLPDAAFAKVSRETAKAMQARLVGHIVYPGSPDYDKDRKVFNPVFDPHPVLIVYCAAVSDVAYALALARDSGAGFAVRSSGHCAAGFSANNGILIDVGGLDSFVVDPMGTPPTATAGPGAPFGKVHATLASYGLHVPGGECPDVCVAGYTMGGGYGFTSVTFGMNCDNVLSFQVMLADGSIVTASETENYDLWWAMCGGTGGNFGVMLSVTYRLVRLGPVFGFALAWPLRNPQDIANAAAVMMLLQDRYMLSSPYAPNMNLQITFCYQNWILPSDKPPPNAPLQPYFMIRGLWVGDATSGSAAIRPLQAMPGCITQWAMPGSFVDMNQQLLNYPQSLPDIDSVPYFDKSSRYVTQNLTLAQWSALIAQFTTSPNNGAYGYLEFYGGAINAVPIDRNAFVHRSSAFNAVMDILWFDGAGEKACRTFLDGWNALVAPVWNGEVYQNYCSLSVPDYESSYWMGNAWGLWAVKRKYDPTGFFSFAQAVVQPPAIGPIGPVIVLPPRLADALAQPIARANAESR